MKLELYYKETCPFSQRVLRFLEKEPIDGIEMKDISKDAEAEKTLVEVGGKKQVPCLFVDGKPMYESMDIIKFLQENK